MKPICVKCQRFYKPIKTGYYFLEGMPTNNAEPGLIDAHLWKPYKLWSGDLYECQGCKNQTIVGIGYAPLGEHYDEPRFSELVKELNVTFQVNDC